MRIGVIGLGRLGLPVALTIERAGHDVAGWDISDIRRSEIHARSVSESSHEDHLAEYLATSAMEVMPVRRLVDRDVLLVCVQTPHEPRFEGATPVTDPAEDFDYTWLRTAISDIAAETKAQGTDPLIVIVSTCLPGTYDRHLRATAEGLRIAYHPLFIAMGSVISDYRNPEFILVGSDDEAVPRELNDLYAHCPAPLRNMSITSAELTKVAYNAAIGYKLMLANAIGELADTVGANCDDVMDTLKLADNRLVSTAYMTPGMGDGGGCHPRDQIALSWLAREVDLSHDPFAAVIHAREAHARWLAHEWELAARAAQLPTVMLGEAYKANTALTVGSHARLVAHYAQPDLVTDAPLTDYPIACYFLATPHDHFLAADIPAGAVVVDPWGLFPQRDGVHVIALGRRERRPVGLPDPHQLPRPSDPPAITRRMA